MLPQSVHSPMFGKSLNEPRTSLTSSFGDKNPLYALFIYVLEKKIFFSREPRLPDFVQKIFYGNPIRKRSQLAIYPTTEANVTGNI